MNRVVHFEIHARDREVMKKFYQDVFGWTMEQMGSEMGDYVVVRTGSDSTPGDPSARGIDGGITLRKGDLPVSGQPVNAFVNIISVENTDASIEKVKVAGGTIALDKMDVPGVGLLAYCKDPEGNIFGILQPSPAMTK